MRWRSNIVGILLCFTGWVAAQEYTLVWNEDFTDVSLDEQVWTIEVNADGGWNNELQYYCEQGVTLGVEPTTGKQCLILTAAKEEPEPENWQGMENISEGKSAIRKFIQDGQIYISRNSTVYAIDGRVCVCAQK